MTSTIKAISSDLVDHDQFVLCLTICELKVGNYYYDYKQQYSISSNENPYNITITNVSQSVRFVQDIKNCSQFTISTTIDMESVINDINRINDLSPDQNVVIFAISDTLDIYLNRHILKIQCGQNYYSFLKYFSFSDIVGQSNFNKLKSTNKLLAYSRNRLGLDKMIKMSSPLYDDGLKLMVEKHLKPEYKLFDHQVSNIKWIYDTEHTENHCYYYLNPLLYHSFGNKVETKAGNKNDDDDDDEITNSYVINVQTKKIYNVNQLYGHGGLNSIDIHGGIICDPVGMGKTLSIIGSLITYYLFESLPLSLPSISPSSEPISEPISNIKSDAKLKLKVKVKPVKGKTLIICPSRIVKQWVSEFEKFLLIPNSIKVGYITTYADVTKFDIDRVDVVVVTPNLINNATYLKNLLIRDNKLFNLLTYPWMRIIIDEIHEMHDKTIMSIYGKYKWGLSASPLPVNKSVDQFYNIMNFLQNKNELPKEIEGNLVYHRKNYENIIENYFRLNDTTEITLMNYKFKNIIIEPTELEQIVFKNTRKALDNDMYSSIYINSKFNNLAEFSETSHMNVISNMIKQYTDTIQQLLTIREKLENDVGHNHFVKIDKIDTQIKLYQTYIDQLQHSEEYSNKCKLCDFESNYIVIQPNGHYFCAKCIECLLGKNNTYQCPVTGISIKREDLKKHSIKFKEDTSKEVTERGLATRVMEGEIGNVDSITQMWGSKMSHIYHMVSAILFENLSGNSSNGDTGRKIIIYSQLNNMIKFIQIMLKYYSIESSFCAGNIYSINKSLNEFNTSKTCNILLLSSMTNNSGMNLTIVTDIILVDTILNPNYKQIEQQSIGRAVRFGQKNIVNVVRLVTNHTPEYEKYLEISKE